MDARLKRILLTSLLAGLAFAGHACGGSQAAPPATATAGSSLAPAASPSTTGSATAPAGSGASAATKLGTSAGVATTAKAPDFEPLPGAKAQFGTLGKAVYRIEVPDHWNGELVLWAHGYRGPGTEVNTENPPNGLRKTLVEEGYAWAASSYSENGYTPGIGADDTLALKRLFEQKVGKPKRTYIAGSSMGGNVVALSLEYFPTEYDGALAMCGALGGEEEIDYLVSWNRLAEYLSGAKIAYGPGTTTVQATASLGQVMAPLGDPAAPTDKGRQFLSLIRMLTGGPRPFFIEGVKQQWVVNFAFVLIDPEGTSLPGRAATNEATQYAIEPGLGLTAEQVNGGVVRQKADPQARNATLHPDAVPTTGQISVPLLTLHNTGDLFVPVSQEQSYRRKADAAGKGDLLVQRLIRDGGHCKFSDQELTTAWNDLRAWVADKKKPKGDDLLGDLSDAGRQFTNPLRPNDPGTK